jgi:hypothetical protein
MDLDALNKIATAMVAPGKGILAADESTSTIKKRFDAIGAECTENNRRDYRELMFRATEAMRSHISGAAPKTGPPFNLGRVFTVDRLERPTGVDGGHGEWGEPAAWRPARPLRRPGRQRLALPSMVVEARLRKTGSPCLLAYIGRYRSVL